MSAVWAAQEASEFHALVSPLLDGNDDIRLQSHSHVRGILRS